MNIQWSQDSLFNKWKIGQTLAKNETRSPTYTIHKNKLKMDKGIKLKMGNHKVLQVFLEESIGGKIANIPYVVAISLPIQLLKQWNLKKK